MLPLGFPVFQMVLAMVSKKPNEEEEKISKQKLVKKKKDKQLPNKLPKASGDHRDTDDDDDDETPLCYERFFLQRSVKKSVPCLKRPGSG